MVNTSVTIAAVVTLFISFILPIILCIVYSVRNRGKKIFTAWLLGAAGFVVMQLIIRLPLLNLISVQPGFADFVTSHYILYCLILAFTAGLFELVGRVVAAKIMQKNLTFERSIGAGLGHGGIEAILIVGITYINNLVYIYIINSGSFDTIVGQTAALGADTTSLLALRETFLNATSLPMYLAGYERLLTMIVHVALSLLVCYYISIKKGLKGMGICLGLHCALDFVPPVISGMANGYVGNFISVTTSQVITYIYLTAMAGFAIFFILKIKAQFKTQEQQ